MGEECLAVAQNFVLWARNYPFAKLVWGVVEHWLVVGEIVEMRNLRNAV